MEVWLKDEESGIEIGVNNDGELFIGNKDSGGNYTDTKQNREKIIRDFCRYTGRQKPITSESGKPITDCDLATFRR